MRLHDDTKDDFWLNGSNHMVLRSPGRIRRIIASFHVGKNRSYRCIAFLKELNLSPQEATRLDDLYDQSIINFLLHHLTLERVQQLAFTTSDDPEGWVYVLNRHLPKKLGILKRCLLVHFNAIAALVSNFLRGERAKHSESMDLLLRCCFELKDDHWALLPSLLQEDDLWLKAFLNHQCSITMGATHDPDLVIKIKHRITNQYFNGALELIPLHQYSSSQWQLLLKYLICLPQDHFMIERINQHQHEMLSFASDIDWQYIIDVFFYMLANRIDVTVLPTQAEPSELMLTRDIRFIRQQWLNEQCQHSIHHARHDQVFKVFDGYIREQNLMLLTNDYDVFCHFLEDVSALNEAPMRWLCDIMVELSHADVMTFIALCREYLVDAEVLKIRITWLHDHQYYLGDARTFFSAWVTMPQDWLEYFETMGLSDEQCVLLMQQVSSFPDLFQLNNHEKEHLEQVDQSFNGSFMTLIRPWSNYYPSSGLLCVMFLVGVIVSVFVPVFRMVFGASIFVLYCAMMMFSEQVDSPFGHFNGWTKASGSDCFTPPRFSPLAKMSNLDLDDVVEAKFEL